MKNTPLESIVKFVECTLSVDEFVDVLYYDEDLERLLSEEDDLPYIVKSYGSLYLFLLEQDIGNDLGGWLNSVETLARYLERKGIKYTKSNDSYKIFDISLKVVPRWANVPDSYMKKLLELAGDRHGKELEEFLKNEIRRRFKCLKGRPRWLQEANWIFRENEPLLFVGQLDITAVRHDVARLYIFMDERSGEFAWVEQAM